MKHCIRRIWCEDEGVLTFEWVLLVTLLTIGVVSGLAAARDAVIDELGDVLWYVAQLSRVLHTPLSAVMENNLQKLAHRKEAGTLKGDARDGR